MMRKSVIYLVLQGRVGNQLFQYAFARRVQSENKNESIIVIDDSRVLKCGWENSLLQYHLPGVEYIHENIVGWGHIFTKRFFFRGLYKLVTKHMGFCRKYKAEQVFNKLFKSTGMFICENGYIEPCVPNDIQEYYLEGFFQSEKYFDNVKLDIKELLSAEQFDQLEKYTGINKLRARNSVCISVKVEHNVGSSLYDVCGIDYWKKAIHFITERVNDPLFFICSDNVEFVLDNLIDASEYDYLVQDASMPVHISLAAMSACKHFIIGNTTFGWWAQYLSKNNDKIVVAPSRWMAVDMPIDIYQDGWHLIEV